MEPTTGRKFNYGSQLALLVISFGFSLLIIALLSRILATSYFHVAPEELAATLARPEHLLASRLIQILYSLIGFGLPTVIVYTVFYHDLRQQLDLKKGGNLVQAALLPIILLLAYFSAPFFTRLMEWIPIRQDLANSFRELEEAYIQQARALGNIRTPGDYVFSLVVLAFVPALCEELLFRAGFQKIFYRMWNNTAIALLASGIIFSLMHFSYYNFLSRLFLSIVLGWLYQYGKSLWFSITAHFLNNAAAVTLMYIAAVQHRDLQQYDQDPATWISALLLLPLAGMLYLYSKQNKQL